MVRSIIFFSLFTLFALNAQSTGFFLIDTLRLERFDSVQLRVLKDYLQHYHRAKHDSTRYRILIQLCSLMVKQHYPYSRAYLRFSEQTIDKRFPNYRAKLYYLFALYYMGHDYSKAIEYGHKSLRILKKYPDKWLKSYVLNTIGNAYREQGKSAQALKYYYESLKVREEIGDEALLGTAYSNIALAYSGQGKFDKAQEFYSKALHIAQKLRDSMMIVKTLINFGSIYYYQMRYEQALKLWEQSFSIAKHLGNKQLVAYIANNIAVIYKRRGDYAQALEYLFKSLKIEEELGNKKGMAAKLNNIGLIYVEQGMYDKALTYYLKALALHRELQNYSGVANVLSNIGSVYFYQKRYEEALSFYLKALETYKRIGNSLAVSERMHDIAVVYEVQGDYVQALNYYFKALRLIRKIAPKRAMLPLKGIGNVYFQLGYYQKALKYAWQSYRLAQETKDIQVLRDAAALLSKIYERIGNAAKAFHFYKIYIQMRDSIQNERHQRELIRKDLQYQYEKEKAIQEAKHKAELEKQKALAQAQRKRQNIIIASISAILLIVLVFSVVLYNRLQVIRQQRDTIIQQNAILEQQKEELRVLSEDLHRKNAAIMAQSQELRRLNEQLQKQNDELERKNKAITDSIAYASRIQRALLRKSDELRKTLPHCLIYLPCQQVSGDFYWIAKQQEYFYIAVADCTGHGVPGALISIMGMEYLNTLLEEGVHEPCLLLEQLRQHIIQTLSGSKGEYLQDGMDIALAKIDFHKKTIYWSAANSRLYCIHNGQLDIFHGDKQPVGWYPKMQPFQQHTYQWKEKTFLCFFSDGFPDQFGGKNGRKLGYKRFQQLLLTMQKFPIQEWEYHLTQVFHRWRGKYAQIDDVTFLGIQLS